MPYQVGITKVIDTPPYHSLQNMKIYKFEEVTWSEEEIMKRRQEKGVKPKLEY
jgi:hypothetical protein